MKALERLFFVLPLMVIFILLSITILVPISYWVITGKDWSDAKDKIIDLVD